MKKTIWLFLAALFAAIPLVRPVVAETRQVIYFKEATCEVCAELEGYPDGLGTDYDAASDYLQKLRDQGIDVIVYDILLNPVVPEYGYTDDDGNEVEVTAIDVYHAFNEAYYRTSSAVPVLFVGDTYYEGLSDIQQAIDQNDVFAQSASSLLDVSVVAETRQVIYFKEATCEVCAELEGFQGGAGVNYDETKDYLKKMRDQGITVIIYDILLNPVVPEYGYTDDDGNEVEVTAIDVFAAFNETYDRPGRDVPVIFVGDSYFEGLSDIQQAVDQNTVFELSDDPLLEVSVEEGQAYRDLTGIVGFFVVLGAGLLDGFNPCAIALLLLFISLLGFTDDKKVLILVSVVYIFALFVSYFLIGTFFLNVLERYASGIAVLGTVINWFVLFLCLFLFLFNLYDFWQARREDYGKIKNQLPKWLQRYNKKIVQLFTSVINKDEKGSLITVLVVTFLLGITLSVTELVCTGQIYFGILYGIHTMETAYAYVLLLVYNLMFVMPLIVIAVTAIRLKSIVTVSNWVREHMAGIKLGNAILFFTIFVFFLFRVLGGIL
jgi:cytochrome c biogenesis protein CcdA/glutaredoxin